EFALEAGRAERGLHGYEIVRRGEHFDRTVVVINDVLRAGIERDLEQPILIGSRREYDLAAMLEQEGHRAVGSQIAAVLGKRVPDIGNGARPVVGETIDDHCGAVDAVALIADFLVVHSLLPARAALDSALDRVLRHVVVHRLVHREPQPGIARNIRGAELCRDRNLPDEAAENLAAFGIGRRLAVLDVRPLAVTGHGRDNAIGDAQIIRATLVAYWVRTTLGSGWCLMRGRRRAVPSVRFLWFRAVVAR